MAKTPFWADKVQRDRAAAVDTRAYEHAGRVRGGNGETAALQASVRTGALRLVPSLVAALTLALGVLGGTAYAYFSSTGTGSGQASVGKLAPVIVEQASTTPGSLFPGGKAGLSLRVKNPNDRSLTLVGVAEVGTTVTVTPATASCTGTSAGVSVSGAVASGLSYTLEASTTTTGVTALVIPTGAQMSTASPSACQNKSFHIKMTVTVHS